MRRLWPEVAWADLAIEGAGEQPNLDLAKGFDGSWGCSSKDAPRLETIDGKRAMVVRADRGRYRRLDLKAGDKVTVKAAFRLMGPSAAPPRQRPLDVSAAVNATAPERVTLPYAKHDFIGIFVRTADPAAHDGKQCVQFRNRAMQDGLKELVLMDGQGLNGRDARSTRGVGLNGRDARSTRGDAPCGTGILPVQDGNGTEPCRYLYLLLASSYTKGPELATVRVTYADGSQDSLPLVKGRGPTARHHAVLRVGGSVKRIGRRTDDCCSSLVCGFARRRNGLKVAMIVYLPKC